MMHFSHSPTTGFGPQPGSAQRNALKAAAGWYAQLCAGPFSASEQAAWQSWHQENEAHRWAWEQVRALQSTLQSVPAQPALQTLAALPASLREQRRRLLKGSTLLLAGGAFGWLGYRSAPWQEWTANHRTGTGERREWQLADGSTLILNTNSAVDVVFSADTRLVRLHRGEVLVQTNADAAVVPRPFIVDSAQGRMRALGTRFVVRQDEGSTKLSVLQHAVEVRTHQKPASPVTVQAGQQLRFSDEEIGTPVPADTLQAAWTRGLLVVADWRLADFVTELARYREGWLHCDPAVAELRISGAFPIDDTDAALSAMAKALPVTLMSRTRYWVTVGPR